MKQLPERQGFVIEALITIIIIVMMPFIAIPHFHNAVDRASKCGRLEQEKRAECYKYLEENGN